jgi:hypothetical protein
VFAAGDAARSHCRNRDGDAALIPQNGSNPSSTTQRPMQLARLD